MASNTIANGFAIGTSTTQVSISSMNLFDNLNYGIYAINSNVFVSNTAFQNMQQAQIDVPIRGSLNNYIGGTAIYTENTNQTISGRFFQLQALPNQNTSNYNTGGNLFFNNAISVKAMNVQYATINTNIIHSKRIYNS